MALIIYKSIFKPQSSAAKCTFALVNYFQHNKSDVFVLLLDATKSNYVKLLDLLMDRGMNPLLIRCLLYMYINQHLNVLWNNSMSDYFSTTRVVKQGGVSSILFYIYIYIYTYIYIHIYILLYIYR